MYGWMGSILRVDLTSGKISRDPLNERLGREFIGGRGINVKILYDEIRPGMDPLDPENRLIFGTGLLSGTMTASGRVNITALSPLNRILGDSNGGSHFGPELKYTGHDHLVITGRANAPVYLWIENDRVEIRDARHLWGKLSTETRETLKSDLGDPRVQIACIGPAGENRVKMSLVVVGEDGFCGKSGLGAVMGAKNLKAVAVRGTRGIKVARPDDFRQMAFDLRKRALKNPYYPLWSKYGTTFIFKGRSGAGVLSHRNAQIVGPWAGYENLSPERLQEEYTLKKKACFGCLNHCRSWYRVKSGPHAGKAGVGMELSHQNLLGAFLDVGDAAAVYRLLELCNEYGIDSAEAGQVLGAAMEWREKGILTREDLEGLDLQWGNSQAALALLGKIAYRQGLGDLLAEGGVAAARQLGRGAEASISHSKGVLHQTPNMNMAYMLGEAVATRGADHLRGSPWLGGTPGSYEGVARAVYETGLACTIADCLEICKFSTIVAGMEINLQDMARLFEAATGLALDEDGIREIADRVWTLERAFIVREGITRKDDTLAGRTWDEPIKGGPLEGMRVDQAKWEDLLDEYYQLAGWDQRTGIPTRAKCESLGLKDVADELEELGKIK